MYNLGSKIKSMIRFLFVAVLVLLGNINQAKGQDTLSKKASTEKKSGPVKEVNLKSNKEQNKGSLQSTTGTGTMCITR